MPESAPEESSQRRVRQADTADFTFTVSGLSADELMVTRFSGREGLSELFSFRVDLCSRSTEIRPAELVGQACTLEIRAAAGPRYVHGIVRRFARTGEGTTMTHYFAEIVPKVWLLTRRIRSRIFQEHNCSDMTVQGIITKVLSDAGISGDDFRFALQEDYEADEYVVQYRESEWDYISRLAEEAGIFYFFEQTEDGHVLVFGDSPVAYLDTPNETTFPFRDPSAMVSEEDKEEFNSVRDEHQIRIGAVALDDFTFKQPGLDLAAQSTGDAYTSLEYYDYPGRYLDRGVGSHLAEVRLQEFQALRQQQTLVGGVRALLPGHKFTLEEHPDSELNREYLSVAIEHTASQPQSGQEDADGSVGIQYKVEVVTIPSDVDYRPPRKTPLPFVHGSQTAIVVGPQGEEIYTDEYGRVKIQFHWDREGEFDENSSCWVRVSQGAAGGQYGMMFLPRVGQEVIVEHLEGNPNRPIITGRVYNNDQMPPYPLPDEKTKSCIKTNSSKGGGGTNEIRFEDKKGEEQLLFHAEKDLHVRVTNASVETVEGSKSVGVGGDQMVKIGGDNSMKVEGKETYNVAGTRTIDIEGDVVQASQANYKHEIGQTCSIKGMNVKIEASAGLELVCGDSKVVLTPAAVFINGTLINLNSGSGPPVGPVTAQATSTEDPAAADDVEPGHDVTYSRSGSQETAAIEDEETGESSEESAREETSWIRIKLVNEDGEPCPGERYRVVCPDGTEKTGTLDANGQAYIGGIDPGNCDITFPELDRTAWQRRS